MSKAALVSRAKRVIRVAAVGVALLWTAQSGADATPLPVPGVSLRGTHLHLIVAGNPPLAVDAGTGRFSSIALAAPSDEPRVQVVQVGRSAVILGGARCEGCGRNIPAFVVRPGRAAVRLGTASQAAPADGQSVWLLRSTAPGVCSIQRVELNGSRGPARRSRCASQLEGRAPPGLIFNSSILENPTNGALLLRAPGLLAASGTSVVRAPSLGRLALEGIGDRRQVRLRWPSAFSYTETALTDPARGTIAIWFVNGPVDQHIDVWTLDPRTRRFTHVPGFPTAAELKRTSLTWTPDGRLVILTRIDDRDALVVWRPGARTSASEFLNLPTSRSPGVFAIAAW